MFLSPLQFACRIFVASLRVVTLQSGNVFISVIKKGIFFESFKVVVVPREKL